MVDLILTSSAKKVKQLIDICSNGIRHPRELYNEYRTKEFWKNNEDKPAFVGNKMDIKKKKTLEN